MRFVLSSATALLSAGLLLAVDPDPKGLAVPAERTAQAKELVRQLDDNDVDVRDRASKELADMGRFALPALSTALKAKPSVEVQTRIEKLLPAARTADFAARYPVFLADTARRFDHDLPGWNELKQAAGDTPEARKLFAAVLKTEERRGVLAGAFETDPAKRRGGRAGFEGHWGRKWMARLDDLPAAKRNRKLDTPYTVIREPVEYLAGGLIADLMLDRDEWLPGMPAMVKELLNVEDKEAVLAGKGAYKDVLAKLAVRWVETRTHPRAVQDAATVCVEMKLGEELRWRCLERQCEMALKGGYTPWDVMCELARTRDKRYVATIRQFFDGEGDLVVATTDARQPQPRDVSLAMCLLLTDQKPKDYGFDVQSDKVDMRYHPFNYMFLSEKGKTAEEKREAAFEKWAAWEKANPDALKAPPPKEKK
jgi:hypothetical protein